MKLFIIKDIQDKGEDYLVITAFLKKLNYKK